VGFSKGSRLRRRDFHWDHVRDIFRSGERFPYQSFRSLREILKKQIRFAKFSGFKSVLLNAMDPRKVISDQLPDWRAALSSVADIYIIANRLSLVS
jgi:hypothetical protein